MKILWLSHLIPYPPKGGVLQRSYNLLKELSRYHEVDLLAFNQNFLMGSLYESVGAGIKEARSVLSGICRRFEFFDIPSDRSGWGRYSLAIESLINRPYNINWLKSDRFKETLKKWIARDKYDLVHFDTISLVPYFSLLPFKTATCLDHHNIESHMLVRRAGNESNQLKRLYFWQEGKRLARYERRYCPQFSVNITCSDLDGERLARIAPRARVVTIPNGVDLDYFKPQGLPTFPNRLVFVGSMSWYPNVEAALYIGEKLWPQLKVRHQNLVCDIIGAQPPGSVKALGELLPGFNVRGFVDDVRPHIEQATIYVCPIRDGGGTKLKLLDAMAMGKAIVADPIACEGIKVTHGRDVILAKDETEFIEQIDFLLKSTGKREALGDSARDLVEKHYGYEAIGKKLAAVFEDSVR